MGSPRPTVGEVVAPADVVAADCVVILEDVEEGYESKPSRLVYRIYEAAWLTDGSGFCIMRSNGEPTNNVNEWSPDLKMDAVACVTVKWDGDFRLYTEEWCMATVEDVTVILTAIRGHAVAVFKAAGVWHEF